MASAKFDRTEIVTVTENFTLTLSRDEAQTLKDILATVGGSPTNSRRKFIDRIYGALESVGIFHGEPADITGEISFESE